MTIMGMTDRRTFLSELSWMLVGGLSWSELNLREIPKEKVKVALVGTGIRGIGFWGKRIVDNYADVIRFVGLCDINPGRLRLAKEVMAVECSTYDDFDHMLADTNPDLVIVTTVDSTHHDFIIKALDFGSDVITEKPMTTDERKCQDIMDAVRRSGNNLIVGFNYRWSPYATKIKSLLMEGHIGEITSVDFHWYLNNHHGASYFRRWHGQREYGGTLLVHKATHHFDLLNWWLDSDPYEVFAYGGLEHYGSNGEFRGQNCRNCSQTEECSYYWDIMKDEFSRRLYVDNEQYDGYIRDNCLYRHEINIYDKMSVQIKYANQSIVNYSLTTYSPFEGWRVAFNGRKGRIEAWLDIPYYTRLSVGQAELHGAEMNQTSEKEADHRPIIVHRNWNDYEFVAVDQSRGGHGGGDGRLQDRIFKDKDAADPMRHFAGVRDGAMSVLIGIGARKSIESGEPVRIGDLTDLVPRSKRL